MKKQFFKFVLPSMVAFLFSGLYAIVDGFFIGNNIGDIGLAAINIAYPITALLTSIGTGVGMGGAICMALSQARDDSEGARRACGNTMFLLLVISVLLTGLLFFSYGGLLQLLGASGELYRQAEAYIQVIILGTIFQVLGTGLLPLLRNRGAVMLAMFSMVGGFLTNILLDYLFVSHFSWGMQGAAAATILGQIITILPPLFFFLSHRSWLRDLLRPKKEMLVRICQNALSPFGLTLSPNIVIILMNKFCVAYGGDRAVAVYAVIGYILCVAQLLLQGVGDGVQPLISRYAGCDDRHALRTIKRMTYLFAELTAVLFLIISMVFIQQLPAAFGASAETSAAATQTLPFFLFGVLATAFARVTISSYYAVGNHRTASCLVYAEPLLLLLLLFLFSACYGLPGVWLAQPVSQVLLVLLSLLFLKRTNKTALKTPFV